jgi:hypothetical protein
MSYAARAVLVFCDGPILVFVARTGVRTCRCALGRPALAGAVLVKNATACSDLMLFRGRTSIHLENLSIATSRCVKPPGAFCKGPTRSRPHTANDQVMGIVCRA